MVTTFAFITLFNMTAITYNLPSGLLNAICYVESSNNPHAIHNDDGADDSLGLCQIQYKTAKFMGFKGKKQDLMVPSLNVKYAAKYLSYQLIRYNGDIYKSIAAYNAGSYLKSKVYGAKLKAVNHTYCIKVFKAWKK